MSEGSILWTFDVKYARLKKIYDECEFKDKGVTEITLIYNSIVLN